MLFADPSPRLALGDRDAALLRRIGRTPLLELRRVSAHLPPTVRVLAKAEFLNPGGSVKDRPALAMVREGLRTGALGAGQTLLDATSGNTGIAYAMIGAALQFPVALTLPANASPERKRILEAYGAQVILTDPLGGTDEAQLRAQELRAEDPDRYFYPDQYNNDANWRAHYDTTGAEILEQTRGHITDFVAALGTTGTFVGVSRRLKSHYPSIRCHAVQPATPLHGLEGVKHLQTAMVPAIFDPALADRGWSCTTEEAYAMCRRLAREEGLLVGASSGANVAIACRLAEELEAGVVVTVLPDTGTRYLHGVVLNGGAT